VHAIRVVAAGSALLDPAVTRREDPQGKARGLIRGVLAATNFGISSFGVHPLPLELPPGRHRPVRIVAAHMVDVPLVRRLVGQFP
jgi:hypothetical protein